MSVCQKKNSQIWADNKSGNNSLQPRWAEEHVPQQNKTISGYTPVLPQQESNLGLYWTTDSLDG